MDVNLEKSNLKNQDFDFNFQNDNGLFNEYLQNHISSSLISPVREFLNRPQKSIRSHLVKVGYDWALNRTTLKKDWLKDLQFVVEALHSGSLIIDDIQDGSLIRRNQPCFHILQGVPRALNAGNWLYFWAIQHVYDLDLHPEHKNQLVQAIHKTLYEGHFGQALDLGVPVSLIPIEEVENLCRSTMSYKTGVLAGLALSIGPSALLGDPLIQKRFSKVGNLLGVILQMLDDMRNCKVTGAKTSKRFEDLRNMRPSFIWAVAAQRKDPAEFKQLLKACEEMPNTDELLRWQLQYDFEERALTEVASCKAQLKLLTEPIEFEFGHPLWRPLSQVIEKLENAYEKD